MMATATAAAAVVAVAAMAAVTFYSPAAEAHAIGLSSGEYTAKGSSLVGKLAFARGEAASLAPSIDADHDGHLTPNEVESARGALKTHMIDRITVKSGDASCAGTITDAGLTEQDGLLVTARWDCANANANAKTFDVDLALLDDLSRGHRHVARLISAGATHDEVLYGDQRHFSVARDDAATAPATSAGDAAAPAATPAEPQHAGSYGAWSFFKMGIEHILTGYDHLVFILGLVLARARLKALLTVVTAFTLAHSITLALAVLGVWAPSSRIVEPAIALSIAYVGIENFFVKDASKRWRITFPFGLIHGFGFAGALQEINLPRSAIPTALVSFNLGVEAGQLAVLAIVLPLILLLRSRSKWFEPRGVQVVSGAVAIAGGIWFVSRVIQG